MDSAQPPAQHSSPRESPTLEQQQHLSGSREKKRGDTAIYIYERAKRLGQRRAHTHERARRREVINEGSNSQVGGPMSLGPRGGYIGKAESDATRARGQRGCPLSRERGEEARGE